MPALLEPLIGSLQSLIDAETRRDPFRRRRRVVLQAYAIGKWLRAYFGWELRGWRNLPKQGPMLIVGNHSGGMTPVDPMPLYTRWVETRGPDAPLYLLSYDLLFAIPGYGRWLRAMGCIPASHANAARAFAEGAAVLVMPGGDYEVFRPWRERDRITFGGRAGFVRLALRTGVPVVPMTIHGAHESTFVLTRGHEIARWIGALRLKVNVFPIIFNIPLGLTPAFVPSLPLPSKITVQIGKPLDWSHFGPTAARNPRVVRQCYDQITALMQKTLDRLAADEPYPLLARLNHLRPAHLFRGWVGGRRRPRRRKRS